jgi:predicted Zn-dependent protease
MDARALAAHLEQFRRRGARAAELLETDTSGHRLRLERGRVAGAETFRENDLTVRVWLDGGKVAEVHGSGPDLDSLLTEAARKAEKAKPDAHAGPVTRQRGALGGLGIDDRRFDAIDDADREEVLVTAERAARQVDRRVVPGLFTYEDRRTVRRYASTRGVALEEWGTIYTASGTASAERGDERVTRTEAIASRTFASIASLPFGTSLGRRVADLLRSAEPVTGPMRVLLTPNAVAQLFAWIATRFVRPGDPEKARPFFLDPSRGVVLDGRIHLLDDGIAPGGLRTRSFDDRGALPIPLVLIREGRPEGLFVGPEQAHALDTAATGHVRRGLQEPSNLSLRAGGRSINAALSDLGGTVLQVDDLGNLEGLDPETGAVDIPIEGVLLRLNKPIGAVRHGRLQGDLRTVLGRLVEVCSDTDRIGHVDAPAMIVDGFTVVDDLKRSGSRARSKPPASKPKAKVKAKAKR